MRLEIWQAQLVIGLPGGLFRSSARLVAGLTLSLREKFKSEYSRDARKRNLQLEARAHIEVQRWIDGCNLRGRATTREGLCEIHRRFCAELPEGSALDRRPGNT